MRIVFAKHFVLPSPKAHPLQILRTASALARRGHECLVLPGVRPRRSAKDLARDILGDDLPAGLRVLGCPAREMGVSATKRRRKLLRLLLSLRKDLVFYSRNQTETVELLRWRRLLRRPHPVVHEVHNIDHCLPERLGDGVSAEETFREGRIAWEEADEVVAISATLRDELPRCFGGARSVSVIPSGVDLQAFSNLPPPDVERGPVVITYCGGLYAYKGVESLLEALTVLPPQFQLRLVGGSRPGDLDRLRALAAAEPKLGGRVEFRGHVAPTEVPGHLAGSHLLALPAAAGPRQLRYTSPVKLFEYLATGIPVLAAPAESYLSILTAGGDAVVADGIDGRALARAALAAVGDPEGLRRIGERARALAADFTWEKRAERVEAVCRRALEHRGRPG